MGNSVISSLSQKVISKMYIQCICKFDLSQPSLINHL
ncbi:DUF3924 family protein [Acinetobacter albensis]|uniref:DUF3924 family protein n=1 Tax=Acinetobacter albensis TaxID=1673609 RepID=A0ABW9JVX8_9GAMM|nr:DUF3924 family protein [Acinetobacter sp. TTH0-4]